MFKIVGPKLYHKSLNNYQFIQGEMEKHQHKHATFFQMLIASFRSIQAPQPIPATKIYDFVMRYFTPNLVYGIFLLLSMLLCVYRILSVSPSQFVQHLCRIMSSFRFLCCSCIIMTLRFDSAVLRQSMTIHARLIDLYKRFQSMTQDYFLLCMFLTFFWPHSLSNKSALRTVSCWYIENAKRV